MFVIKFLGKEVKYFYIIDYYFILNKKLEVKFTQFKQI